jgi:hypothetical protein
MMMRIVSLLVLLFAWNISVAQTKADTLQRDVHSDPRLKVLVSKHNEVLQKGEANGFRVQIYFGTDKAKAREVKSRFLAAHANEVKAYEIYEVPNFKIRVGDFRTRLEAYRFQKKIKADFPASFIVECKIAEPAIK